MCIRDRVIADKKLTETVPLYKDSSTDLLLPSTQFDMYSAENAGLVKFDFLGLKTLTVIDKSQKIVSKKNQISKLIKLITRTRMYMSFYQAARR